MYPLPELNKPTNEELLFLLGRIGKQLKSSFPDSENIGTLENTIDSTIQMLRSIKDTSCLQGVGPAAQQLRLAARYFQLLPEFDQPGGIEAVIASRIPPKFTVPEEPIFNFLLRVLADDFDGKWSTVPEHVVLEKNRVSSNGTCFYEGQTYYTRPASPGIQIVIPGQFIFYSHGLPKTMEAWVDVPLEERIIDVSSRFEYIDHVGLIEAVTPVLHAAGLRTEPFTTAEIRSLFPPENPGEARSSDGTAKLKVSEDGVTFESDQWKVCFRTLTFQILEKKRNWLSACNAEGGDIELSKLPIRPIQKLIAEMQTLWANGLET